jgi:hypothetical protein
MQVFKPAGPSIFGKGLVACIIRRFDFTNCKLHFVKSSINFFCSETKRMQHSQDNAVLFQTGINNWITSPQVSG